MKNPFPKILLTLASLSCLMGDMPARAGTALLFDGVNDNVTFGAAPSLGVSNFTAE